MCVHSCRGGRMNYWLLHVLRHEIYTLVGPKSQIGLSSAVGWMQNLQLGEEFGGVDVASYISFNF
jgi:hypothetical protein